MSEIKTCGRCGKVVSTTISLSISGGKPTPPLCWTCFDAALKHVEERVSPDTVPGTTRGE